MHMPCMPNVYEMRPQATLRAPPVAVYALTLSAILPYSLPEIPTVTPDCKGALARHASVVASHVASKSMRC
eukprot:3782817-Pyramimonas_sp.AAC.1